MEMHTSIVGSVSLQKCQNSAFYDRAFKLGGDVLWTNRNDLRYGAKKKLQWTHENLHNICNTRKFSFLRPHEHFQTSLSNDKALKIIDVL